MELQPDPASGYQPGPGLIVFGDSLQLRFVNQRARDLLGGTPSVGRGLCDRATLELLQMSEALLKQLHESLVGEEWSYADLHREIRVQDSALDVRAFGFAGLTRRDDVHIVMLLNAIGATESCASPGAAAHHEAAVPAER
jgi:hypothetical protein